MAPEWLSVVGGRGRWGGGYRGGGERGEGCRVVEEVQGENGGGGGCCWLAGWSEGDRKRLIGKISFIYNRNIFFALMDTVKLSARDNFRDTATMS